MMANPTGRAYRIGYLNPYREAAESQAFFSLAMAAGRIGHELVHVTNSDEIIEASPDFVLAVASPQPKTTAVPTFGVIHEPRERFCRNQGYFENLLTYDGYLTISETLHRFLTALCAGTGRPQHVGYFFHHTAQRQSIGCNLEKVAGAGAVRLCYFGTNWDRRDRPLFRALSRRPYMRIYGPEHSWDYLGGSAYCGSVPFDGRSVQRVYAGFGVGLATLSRGHVLDDVVSSRIFEIASVGAVAVCAEIPWIRQHFGDTVFYYDSFQPVAAILDRIDDAIDQINTAPRRAAERAQEARRIFERKFAAEVLLRNAVTYFEEWREREGSPSSPAQDPMVDVIVRVGGRPISTILRAVRSIDSQLAGRFRVIFVRYRPIDLSGILSADWARIAGFEIVDRPDGGRAETLTAGLKAVKCAYFAILDDDDFWLPGHIADLLRHAGQCPPGRAFAYSGFLFVDEPAPGQPAAAGERRQIGRLAPAGGDIFSISGTFAPCCFLASSELLRFVDLDGWRLATAEDNLIEWNLLSRAEPIYTYRATACSVRGSVNASNFANAPTRHEDVLELLARSYARIDAIERKFAPAPGSAWLRLQSALQQVRADRSRDLAGDAAVLALEGAAPVASLHERDDIESREIPLTPERVSLLGQSRLTEHGGEAALAVLPAAQAWAYGASVRIAADDLFSGPQWIVLEFAPVAEAIGAGLQNMAATDFQVRSEVPAAGIPVEIWLYLHDASDVSAVVIHNWAQPSRSHAVLRKLWVVRERAGKSEARQHPAA
jgi:hypothetical protein